MPQGTPAVRGLARAAMALDTVEVARLLRGPLAAAGVVRTWEALVAPLLVAIGERWRETGEGIDVEHAFTEVLLGELRAVTRASSRSGGRPGVLLACAEGDHHTLPLHALAAALAQEGVACRSLGVGMPAHALVAAVRRSGPGVVFLHARLPVLDLAVLDLVPRQRPSPRVVVGGAGWPLEDLPASVAHAATLAEAVEAVQSAVHV